MSAHNHATRDIKPIGKCPACDEYHLANRTADSAILCGPPKNCTCPAVAWYCICEASKRGNRA